MAKKKKPAPLLAWLGFGNGDAPKKKTKTRRKPSNGKPSSNGGARQ